MDILIIKWGRAYIILGVLAALAFLGACGYFIYLVDTNLYNIEGGLYESEYFPDAKPATATLVIPTPTVSEAHRTEPRSVSEFTFFQPLSDGAMFEYELPDVEGILEQGLYGAGFSPTHIAIIGTPADNSVRCNWHGSVMTNDARSDNIRFLLGIDVDDPLPSSASLQATFDSYATRIAPQYRDAMQANFNHLVNGGVLQDSRILACYVDYAISEYLLGGGPTTLTVAYDQLAKSRSYDLYQKAHAAGRYGDDALLTEEQYAEAEAAIVTAAAASINEAIMGRNSVVFLAPMAAHSSISVEAWQAIAQWDVQTIDGVETAVRYGAGPNDTEYSQPLTDFKTRVITAAASDAHAGKRIANASGLPIYYRDIGAYGNIAPDDVPPVIFSPAQPPPMVSKAPTPAPTAVPPRTGPGTAEATKSTVWVTWTAPDDPTVTGYRIWRRVSELSGPLMLLVEDTGNTTTAFLDDQNIKLARTYVYRIQAINEIGLGQQSPRIQTTTGPLPTPQNLAGDAASEGNMVLLIWDIAGWDEVDIANVDGFRVQRQIPGGEFIELARLAPTARKYIDVDDFARGQAYIYRVDSLSETFVGLGARIELIPASRGAP